MLDYFKSMISCSLVFFYLLGQMEIEHSFYYNGTIMTASLCPYLHVANASNLEAIILLLNNQREFC